MLKVKQKQTLSVIRNFLLNQGKSPSVREIQKALGYKSSRSVSLLLNDLIDQGYIKRKENGTLQIMKHAEDLNESAQTINVPLIGHITCGMPIFAEENIEANIPVSIQVARSPYKYFFLRAIGDSMDEKGIDDGDLVLIRQQNTAEKGQSVVALINDEATIKEFCPSNEAIVLKPHSTNSVHKPIILNEEFRIQGVVVKAFKDVF